MKAAVVHYLVHHCGMQECDCLPRCHQANGEIHTTRQVPNVTCKNCIRGIKADDRKATKARSDEMDARRAFAEEYAYD